VRPIVSTYKLPLRTGLDLGCGNGAMLGSFLGKGGTSSDWISRSQGRARSETMAWCQFEVGDDRIASLGQFDAI
jgi:hypothetical protein